MKKFAIILTIITLVALTWVLSGDTENEIERLEWRQLKKQEDRLYKLADFLVRHPDPRKASDLHLFFSRDVINDILAGTKETKVALPKTEGLVLTWKRLEVDFDQYAPSVVAEAQVTKEGSSLQVDATVRTQLHIHANPGGETAELKIEIHEIVPKARWSIFKLELKWLAGKLLALNHHELATIDLNYEIPLDWQTTLSVDGEKKPLSFEVERGRIHGDLTLPALGQPARWSLRQWFFLPDGLHLFLDLNLEEP